MLELLKVDLGISGTSAYDNRLMSYIQAAQKGIEIEGVTLNLNDVGDAQLTIMYAAWQWRKRDTMEGMPRMLRFALNNRIFSEKMRGDNNG